MRGARASRNRVRGSSAASFVSSRNVLTVLPPKADMLTASAIEVLLGSWLTLYSPKTRLLAMKNTKVFTETFTETFTEAVRN
jgi:hypothetical protein